MPKYRTPERIRQLVQEPIEFELAGETFRVDRVPVAVFAAFARMDGEGTFAAVEGVLKAILGEKEFARLGQVDAREAVPLVKWLSEQLAAPLTDEAKNESGSSESSPAPSPDSSATTGF